MKYDFKNYFKSHQWLFFSIISVIVVIILIAKWEDLENFENRKNALLLAGGLLAFICSFIQYRIGQDWKKTEFLAQEYSHFIKDPYVQRVMHILDYPISSFKILDGENIEEFDDTYQIKRKVGDIIIVKCNYEIISIALSEKFDDESENDYDPISNIIRLSFDKFLFKLGLFQKHIDSKLINSADLKPYIYYWIEFLCDPKNKNLNNHQEQFEKMKKELIRFIDRYKYDSLTNLLKTYRTEY